MRAEYNGHTFDERTDWIAILRQGAKGQAFWSWARNDLFDVASVVGDMAETIERSPLADALRGAALDLVEAGSKEEVKLAGQVGYEKAPNAIDRIVAMLNGPRRDQLAQFSSLAGVLWRALQVAPQDSRLLEILRRETERTRDPWLLEMSAAHAVDWFASNLARLAGTPTGHDVFMWVRHTPDTKRAALLDAIDAAGLSRVLVDETNNPKTPAEARGEMLATLRQHPAFASLITLDMNS
jgi:hypothetical protein